MTSINKIYLAVAIAAAIIAGLLAASAISNLSIRKVEKEMEMQKARADELERIGAERETQAAGYREKTEYLEQRLAESEADNRRTDEKLEKLNAITRDARGRVVRARSAGPTAADTDALCQQLAEVGHKCIGAGEAEHYK